MKLNLRRTAAMARKEFIQIWRDPRSLVIAFFLPLVQILMLGYGARLDANHIPVFVLDQDSTQDSQNLLKAFQASPYFDLVKVVDSYKELTRAIDADQCKLGLVIPWSFSQDLHDAAPTKIQALVDGTDNNSAQLAVGYAQAVIMTFSTNITVNWLSRKGLSQFALNPLSVDYRTWFNEDLESKNFIIPGTVAMVMALMGALLSSLTIAREWERGTMEQLIATPVTALEIMIGKLAPYLAIGMADAALSAFFAVKWFRVPFRGGLGTFFLITALFLIVILGIGYVISVVTKNQLAAGQYALLVTLLPTAMLSGYAFPIDQMPRFVRAITYLIYSRYYVSALKRIFLAGIGIGGLGTEIVALGIYAIVVGYVATSAFRKSL